MGSVNSTNGLALLAQTLFGAGAAADSTGSSPNLASFLQSASPADVVELSTAALQLQQTDGLLGISAPADLLGSLGAATYAPQVPAAEASPAPSTAAGSTSASSSTPPVHATTLT